MRFAASRRKPARIYAHGNTRWQQSCGHSNAICNQRFKKRIELRTQEQPLAAEHRRGTNSRMKRPQPQPPHTRGIFHRRPQPLHTEKHKVSCSGFIPKTKPMLHSCSHHNALRTCHVSTWNEGGLRLCHACHAKCRGVPGVTGDQASPSAPPSAMSARLPRETMVDVRLCHACHVKRRWMWGCATPATQSAAASRASRATKPVQARHPVPWVPRLPRETMVDVRLCVCVSVCVKSLYVKFVCVKLLYVRATKPVQARHPVPWVPRLPRETMVDVRLCVCVWVCVWSHCMLNLCVWSYCMWGRPSQSTRATQCHECHACHAKRWWIWDCATPATWKEGGLRLCHACHAKCRGVPGVTGDQASPSAPPSAMSATPATRNDGGCEIVCVCVSVCEVIVC